MPGGIHKVKCTNKPRTNTFIPQPHQTLIIKHMIQTPYRGLLLYHRLGSGKTCTAILVINALFKFRPTIYKHAYIISPGSLRKNFVEEYCKVCGEKQKKIAKKFTFITYNTNVEKFLPKSFDNSVIVIDESHNLMNSVNNKSKNAMAIFNKLIKSKNTRILMLTGTPLYNNMHEISYIFQIIKPGVFNTPDSFLSQLRLVRDKYYPVSQNLFNKLSGVISYVPGLSEELYPKLITMPIQKEVMSDEQAINFASKDEMEREIRAIGPPKPKLQFVNPSKYYKQKAIWMMAVQYVISRKISNFMYPGYSDIDISEELSEGKIPSSRKDTVANKGGWVKPSAFSPGHLLSTYYSAKFYKLLQNIKNNFNEKHMVFSFFKTKSGVNMVHALLEMCGVPSIIYSGDISSDTQRQKILDTFNSKKNRFGDIYKVILATDAGAEGITILETNNIHILESDKRENKIQQIIGRVVRYKSHIDMPADKRFVRVWRYWSVYGNNAVNYTIIDANGKMIKKTINDPTNAKAVDEKLYEKGTKHMNKINSILDILKQVAIENKEK